MPEQPNKQDTIVYGVGRALLRSLWLLTLWLLIIVVPTFYFVLAIWWPGQIALLVPLFLRFRNNGQREAMKGVIIIAALGLLLNGGCDMMISGGLR